MGQISDKLKNLVMTEEIERVPYDETSENGLIIENQYIPEELFTEIFYYVDYKTLLKCQLVCKRWKNLIQSYVWRKKAEMAISHALPSDENAPWTMYYLICHKKPLYRNLIKNHSGKNQFSNWEILTNAGDGWVIECPPVGTPSLPEDSVFDGENHCFATSYGPCWKHQIIDLIAEGFSEYLLDHVKPTIKISEWYSCRWDCAARYMCQIDLLGKNENSSTFTLLDTHKCDKILQNDEQNQWFKFEHEFSNYGEGLRRIRFSHGGRDQSYWAGHYGSKMAGACIKLELPQIHSSSNNSIVSDSKNLADDDI